MVALLVAGCGGDGGGGPAQTSYSLPGQPLTTLAEDERGRFLLGKALFERLATPEEGLGPLFNASRCSDCHMEPAVGGTSLLLVTKASRYDSGVCSELQEQGGGNIQQRTTPALRALGVLAEPMPVSATEQSVFLAPPLFGLGLLEAVPEADILAREDADDRDGDGISGRAHRRPDGQLGRFGWKADSPSVGHFVDTAIRFEIGLSTPQFPFEEGVNGQPLPSGVDPAPEPEIDQNGVELLTDFVRYLGAPAPYGSGGESESTGPTSTDTGAGESIFQEIGCAGCHVPELRVAAVGGLRDGAVIRPYSDLLLHDMGGSTLQYLRGHCEPGGASHTSALGNQVPGTSSCTTGAPHPWTRPSSCTAAKGSARSLVFARSAPRIALPSWLSWVPSEGVSLGELDDGGPLPASEALATCPHCGEGVVVLIDSGGGAHQEYVEDCEVCCRPWRVQVHYDHTGTASVVLEATE